MALQIYNKLFSFQSLLVLKCGVKSQSFGRQNAIPPFDSGMNTFTAIMRDFPSLEAVTDVFWGISGGQIAAIT